MSECTESIECRDRKVFHKPKFGSKLIDFPTLNLFFFIVAILSPHVKRNALHFADDEKTLHSLTTRLNLLPKIMLAKVQL